MSHVNILENEVFRILRQASKQASQKPRWDDGHYNDKSKNKKKSLRSHRRTEK